MDVPSSPGSGKYGPQTSKLGSSKELKHKGSSKKAAAAAAAAARDEEKGTELRERRRQRFIQEQQQQEVVRVYKDASEYYTSSDASAGDGEFSLDKLCMTGTSQKLEKDYLRLTSAPHPSTVRPERVLKEAVAALQEKWKAKPTTSAETEGYLWMCSQLKAIRQDLLVQHIVNEFSVSTYEMHARIALECLDLNEYNQCQTQLKQLYYQGIRGCEMEFVAYRILYYVYLQGNNKYQGGSADLAFILMSLSEEAYAHPAVRHALSIRSAIQQDDLHRFFKLLPETPNKGICILRPMLNSWRLKYLIRMCKGFKPSILVSFIRTEMAFDTHQDCVMFLQKAGCLLVQGPTMSEEDLEVNTKETVVDASAVFDKAAGFLV